MTDSDCPKIFKENCGPHDEPYIYLHDAQRLFQTWYDKQDWKVGYTCERLSSKAIGTVSAYGPISPSHYSVDTHRIIYRTEPLEEEKVECDLHHKTILWQFKDEYGDNPDDICGCPKCGMELK